MIVILAATAALNAGNAARLSASAGMMGPRRLRGAESPTQTREVMRPVAGHAFSEFELTHCRPRPGSARGTGAGLYGGLRLLRRPAGPDAKPVLDFDAWKALETAPRRA